MKMTLYQIVNKETNRRLMYMRLRGNEPYTTPKGVFFRTFSTIKKHLDLLVREGAIVQRPDEWPRWIKGDVCPHRMKKWYVEIIKCESYEPIQIMEAEEALR